MSGKPVISDDRVLRKLRSGAYAKDPPATPVKVKIHPVEVRARLRRIVASRFAATHVDAPFEAPIDGGIIMVHTDPETKRWRLTWFDKRGPGGHSFAEDYKDAVFRAVREYGADLSKVTFPSWIRKAAT